MTMRDTLEEALRMPQGETVHRLQEAGIAIATIDSMANAIHDVYCGITADHSHPNDKDRDQARAMLEALQKHPLP
jgi:formylmethanofuran dehydrogenase subunit B